MALSKIIFAVRAKPGLTRAQALDHLANRHAPLVAASTTVRRRLRTYVQNRAVDAPGVPDQTSDRDWIVEGWRDMQAPIPDPPEADDAIALREDEARFPDRATLLAIAVDEVIIGGTDADHAPVKIFSYYRRGAHARAGWPETWIRSAEALRSHPAFKRWCRGLELNIARPGEGQPAHADAGPSAPLVPLYDGIEIWRFSTIADAEAMFADADARSAVRRHEDNLDRDAHFRFVAEEHVIFDDALATRGLRQAG